jgi:hypothetical protein
VGVKGVEKSVWLGRRESFLFVRDAVECRGKGILLEWHAQRQVHESGGTQSGQVHLRHEVSPPQLAHESSLPFGRQVRGGPSHLVCTFFDPSLPTTLTYIYSASSAQSTTITVGETFHTIFLGAPSVRVSGGASEESRNAGSDLGGEGEGGPQGGQRSHRLWLLPGHQHQAGCKGAHGWSR